MSLDEEPDVAVTVSTNGGPASSSWPDLGDLHPARDPDPLVRAGDYDAKCVGASVAATFGGRRSLILKFRIVACRAHPMLDATCPEAGKVVALYATLPARDKAGHFRRGVAQSSKFYRAWVTANRGQQPRRRDRMSLAPFRDALFAVRVRTVTKDHQQRPLADAHRYSVVDELVQRIA